MKRVGIYLESKNIYMLTGRDFHWRKKKKTDCLIKIEKGNFKVRSALELV